MGITRFEGKVATTEAPLLQIMTSGRIQTMRVKKLQCNKVVLPRLTRCVDARMRRCGTRTFESSTLPVFTNGMSRAF
jgi:hypothetical protein